MPNLAPQSSLGRLIYEQVRWLACKAATLRAARDWTALPAVSVAQDIAHDCARACAALSAKAYTAEQNNLEAVALIETAAADGFTASGIVGVTTAVRLIRASAAANHDLAEATTLPPDPL